MLDSLALLREQGRDLIEDENETAGPFPASRELKPVPVSS